MRRILPHASVSSGWAPCSAVPPWGIPSPGRDTSRVAFAFGDNDLGFDFPAEEGREWYGPYRWQITDQGLTKDAMETCMRELTLRQQQLNAAAAAHRAQMKNENPQQ
ncbi:hypothetical protein [Streptomyces sp. NBC_00162]|uniref:hypothetical protein n=1 Tax=Streptomyces sp. NBC_00162 TaxID=2903629 RepID=UPI00214B8BE9|nr:hypothetical protein [Streptomyces sp. NBC_00162]UUU37681.1 hypothetical protein JIW86_01385 [Streptomyces sp. NBC_00162]